jgi:hypothetical protein
MLVWQPDPVPWNLIRDTTEGQWSATRVPNSSQTLAMVLRDGHGYYIFYDTQANQAVYVGQGHLKSRFGRYRQPSTPDGQKILRYVLPTSRGDNVIIYVAHADDLEERLIELYSPVLNTKEVRYDRPLGPGF